MAKPIGISENNYILNGGAVVELQGISYHTFLESDLTKEAGQYHLSSYNVVTGNIERFREDFWPLSDEFDYIFKYKWKADEQKLFMQSYLGHVWIFDLKDGKDDVHLLKYPVIPHSTTGAPSVFLSPTFKTQTESLTSISII